MMYLHRFSKANATFAAVGEFLKSHGLPPTPDNYTLAYCYVTRSDAMVVARVESALETKATLDQEDCDTIREAVDRRQREERESVRDGAAETAAANAQAHIHAFSNLVDTAHHDTHKFEEALTRTLKDIGLSDHTVDDIVALTTGMVERTRVAEARLSAVRQQTRLLRSKLEDALETARKDELTGLPNRRTCVAHFESEARVGRRMTIAICDIDRFKAINDQFGHGLGDRVLKAIADALKQACGKHMVCRYGGEEFVILFSDTDPDEAYRIVEQARMAVALRDFKIRESGRPIGDITFSAGLATAKDGELRDMLFQRADKMLYLAKASGRNRVEVAG